AEERREISDRDRFDAADGSRPLDRLALELASLRFVVALRSQLEAQHREPRDIESRIDVLDCLKAADEETGADERDERERDLAGDERLLHGQPSDAIELWSVAFQLGDQVGP